MPKNWRKTHKISLKRPLWPRISMTWGKVSTITITAFCIPAVIIHALGVGDASISSSKMIIDHPTKSTDVPNSPN